MTSSKSAKTSGSVSDKIGVIFLCADFTYCTENTFDDFVYKVKTEGLIFW